MAVVRSALVSGGPCCRASPPSLPLGHLVLEPTGFWHDCRGKAWWVLTQWVPSHQIIRLLLCWVYSLLISLLRHIYLYILCSPGHIYPRTSSSYLLATVLQLCSFKVPDHSASQLGIIYTSKWTYLRSSLLSIKTDNQVTSSIFCPLEDFLEQLSYSADLERYCSASIVPLGLRGRWDSKYVLQDASLLTI